METMKEQILRMLDDGESLDSAVSFCVPSDRLSDADVAEVELAAVEAARRAIWRSMIAAEENASESAACEARARQMLSEFGVRRAAETVANRLDWTDVGPLLGGDDAALADFVEWFVDYCCDHMVIGLSEAVASTERRAGYLLGSDH